MHISRTPLRITLGGGGTDLPSYYEQAGHGFLIAAAIDKYVYVATHDNFANRYLVKYSQIEDVQQPEDIEHPMIREAIRATATPPGVEISSMADIPSGTGLGSSGAFAVGLLNALHFRMNNYRTSLQLAAEACQIEIDTLLEPVGKQDQYVAAVGGLIGLTFESSGQVIVSRVVMPQDTEQELEEHLLLFFTGVQRRASDELSALQRGTSAADPEVRSNLDRVRDLGYQSYHALQDGDLETFGRLLSRQWFEKLSRSPSPLHRTVDSWIASGVDAGALGGKLIGAGGGGFLLFLAENARQVRCAMQQIGLLEVRFRFDFAGTRIIN